DAERRDQCVGLPEPAVHRAVAEDELDAHDTPDKPLARHSRWRERVKTVRFYPVSACRVNARRRNITRLRAGRCRASRAGPDARRPAARRETVQNVRRAPSAQWPISATT